MLNLDGTAWATVFAGAQRFHTGVIAYTAGTTFSISMELNYKLSVGQTIFIVTPLAAATTALVFIGQKA